MCLFSCCFSFDFFAASSGGIPEFTVPLQNDPQSWGIIDFPLAITSSKIDSPKLALEGRGDDVLDDVDDVAIPFPSSLPLGVEHRERERSFVCGDWPSRSLSIHSPKIRLVVLNDQKNYTMTRARLLVSIALSYVAAKGSAYETQDTSFMFDVSDFGLTPELSEGLGGDDAAASADTCFDGRCRDSPTYMSIMSLPCHEHTFFDCALFIDGLYPEASG